MISTCVRASLRADAWLLHARQACARACAARTAPRYAGGGGMTKRKQRCWQPAQFMGEVQARSRPRGQLGKWSDEMALTNETKEKENVDRCLARRHQCPQCWIRKGCLG